MEVPPAYGPPEKGLGELFPDIELPWYSRPWVWVSIGLVLIAAIVLVVFIIQVYRPAPSDASASSASTSTTTASGWRPGHRRGGWDGAIHASVGPYPGCVCRFGPRGRVCDCLDPFQFPLFDYGLSSGYTNILPPEAGDKFTIFNDNALPEPTPQEAGTRNYTFYPHIGGAGIELEHQTDLQYRTDELRRACETTPGCKGFESKGVLLSEIKPRPLWEMTYPDRMEGTWIAE